MQGMMAKVATGLLALVGGTSCAGTETQAAGPNNPYESLGVPGVDSNTRFSSLTPIQQVSFLNNFYGIEANQVATLKLADKVALGDIALDNYQAQISLDLAQGAGDQAAIQKSQEQFDHSSQHAREVLRRIVSENPEIRLTSNKPEVKQVLVDLTAQAESKRAANLLRQGSGNRSVASVIPPSADDPALREVSTEERNALRTHVEGEALRADIARERGRGAAERIAEERAATDLTAQKLRVIQEVRGSDLQAIDNAVRGLTNLSMVTMQSSDQSVRLRREMQDTLTNGLREAMQLERDTIGNFVDAFGGNGGNRNSSGLPLLPQLIFIGFGSDEEATFARNASYALFNDGLRVVQKNEAQIQKNLQLGADLLRGALPATQDNLRALFAKELQLVGRF